MADGEAKRTSQRPHPTGGRDAGGAAVPRAAEAAGGLGAGPAGLLRVLAERPDQWLTRAQITALAGRRGKSSAVDRAFALFNREGYVEKAAAGGFRITEAGRAAVGTVGTVDPLEAWAESLTGVARRVFDALRAEYPEFHARARLLEMVGAPPKSSANDRAFAALRRNKLLEESGGGIRLNPILMGDA